VPGCFDFTRGGPVQAYDVSVNTFLLHDSEDWKPLGVISQPQSRASSITASSDSEGNVFVAWNSEIPCQSGSQRVVARAMDSGRSIWAHGPVTLLTGSTIDFHIAPTGRGSLIFSWSTLDTSSGQVQSALYAGVLETSLNEPRR
jgi:hypothetical protein